MNWEHSKQLLKSEPVAFLTVSAILTIAGVANLAEPNVPVWDFLVSILISWVVADSIVSFVLRGGQGIFQIRVFGNQTQEHGYAYIAFATMIVLATLLSSGISIGITYLVTISPWFVLVDSFLGGGLVSLDLHARFLKRDVQKLKK